MQLASPFIEQHDVGECSANVDADQHGVPLRAQSL